MDVKRAFHKWCEGCEGKLQDLIWGEIRFEFELFTYSERLVFFFNRVGSFGKLGDYYFFIFLKIDRSSKVFYMKIYFCLLMRNYSIISKFLYSSLRISYDISIYLFRRGKLKALGIFFKRNFYPSLQKITILLLLFWWKIKEFLSSLNEIYESSAFFIFV